MSLWPDARAAELARLWGLSGRLKRLTGERDTNFRLDEADGGQWVLKISHPEEAPSVGAFQAEALIHVVATDPGLPVPRVRRTLDGQPWHLLAAAQTPDGHPRLVRVVSWLEGVPVASRPQGPASRAALGRVMARLDRALAGFSHPGQDHDLVWDLSRAHELRDRLGHVTDPDLRRLTSDVLEAHAADWGPRAAGMRRQVIHNDMNPHNILMDEAAEDRLAGIIDFGDMVAAPLVNELGVALSYQPVDGAHPLAAAGEVLAAYHALYPLTAEEFAVLPGLIRTRMAATVATSHWLASIRPENRDYLLRNMPRAAAGLARLARLPEAEAAAYLRRACDNQED